MVEATIAHGTRSAGEVDFGDVLNRRTSVRKYGDEPLTIEQLGIFLYRLGS